ncbi:MAG: c-type cytochrome [Bryobacteraceae bacterium]
MKRIIAALAASLAWSADVPKTWDPKAVAELEVPLADPRYSPVHISEQLYYSMPERVIYKSYPVYHPDREPTGYREWLQAQEPQVAFAAADLKTKADWIRAGETVFQAAASFGPVFFGPDDVRNREFYEKTGTPVGSDGIMPFARWVVRKKGVVELGSMGCATCHTRVMADGAVIAGAQGNNPGDRQGAWMLRRAAAAMGEAKVVEQARRFARQFEMPWLDPDPNRRARTMTLAELLAAGEAIPPGVNARAHTSMFVPPQVPDLIGVGERRYLDHTGLVRQRTIGDLMRYTALVQDLMGLARYGGPAPDTLPKNASRFSDAQLYALAQYLYSLEPPPNPNRFDERAARGKKVFERERCARCHPAPLYTNNKLAPVEGFVPGGQARRFDVMAKGVGTDPRYALQSKKGTGFYKVPSIKGVWYRGPFEHNGRAATLEDWFDPARLREGYVPTGFKDAGGPGPVRGHEYGLRLEREARADLIAFLRTL